MDITLNTPLTDFPGVGPARSAKLEKLGLTRVRDLMTYFPRDYEDRRKIWSIRSAPLGVKVCVQAMAAEHPRLSRIRKGMELVKVKAVDHAGALHITFFNQSYVERAIQAGEEYVFWGVVEEQGSRRTMVNPIFERTDRQAVTGCILPVYPLTAGISNHLLCSLIRPAVEACASQMPESLPRSVRVEHELAQIEFSFCNIHFPDSPESLDPGPAAAHLRRALLPVHRSGHAQAPPGRCGRPGGTLPPAGGISLSAPLPSHPGPAPGDGRSSR